MEARDWIELGLFVLAAMGTLVASIRYIDSQISDLKLKVSDRAFEVDRQLADKLSIGEYGRQHRDHEMRIRAVERWQDHANGRARFSYPREDEENQD